MLLTNRGHLRGREFGCSNVSNRLRASVKELATSNYSSDDWPITGCPERWRWRWRSSQRQLLTYEEVPEQNVIRESVNQRGAGERDGLKQQRYIYVVWTTQNGLKVVMVHDGQDDCKWFSGLFVLRFWCKTETHRNWVMFLFVCCLLTTSRTSQGQLVLGK